MNQSTNQQKKTIHTLAHALGISDDDRRDAMEEAYGVRSSCNLTYHQAAAYIRHLMDRAAAQPDLREPAPQRYDELGRRPGMATPKQLRMIEAMWASVSIYTEREQRHAAFRAWLFKRFDRSHPIMIEQPLVGKIVRALKAMRTQKENNTHAQVSGAPDHGAAGSPA